MKRIEISAFIFIFFLALMTHAAPAAQKKSKVEKNNTSESQVQSFLTIRKISIRGQVKIESDAILNRLKSKVGERYSEETVREDIGALFKSGFFTDIKAEREVSGKEVDLTYTVVEKPAIAEVTFEGASEIKSEELLETSAIKNFEILNMSKLRDAVDKIQKLYEDKGFFLAKIEYQVVDVKKNETVKVVFKIDENEKIKVKKMTLLGNNHLKDGFLKGRLATQEGGFFSFMSGSGAYKQDAFDRDMAILRFTYFNEGFVQVKIDRPQVYVTPDKRSIYITIRIDEGERYDVGEVDFAGDLLFSREELGAVVTINKQKVFSYENLQKDLGELQAKYGDLGYAFANVIPRTRISEVDKKVDITFEFDKGNKVYFGHINVIGNSKTRDKVVRRELKIAEGELYHETSKRESQENIQRLGFFDDVTFKTSTPPDKPDVLNIDIMVKERNTGSIQLGAGYGSSTGGSLQGQIQQSNFLGKGQKLGAGLNVSRDVSTYFLNFTEPHYNDTDWSLGFDAYQSQSDRYDYKELVKGGAIRVGHPLGEYTAVTFRYRYDNTWLDSVTINGVNITDPLFFPLNTARGDTGSLTTTLEYDKRNDRFSPSKGMYAATTVEYAGVGGSLGYTKGNVTYRYFNKLFWDVVWRNNLSYSRITSNTNQSPPFNQLYLLGGPYTLRGYRFSRVGKTVFSNYYFGILPTIAPGISASEQQKQAFKPIGGTQQALYQMEFEFPLIAEAGIKGVAFYDIGAADDQLTSDKFYSDVGFGFRWFSPIGPLRFEWGFPLVYNNQSPDTVNFEFSIGAPF